MRIAFCAETGLPVLMRVPLDRKIGQGIAQGKPLVAVRPEYADRFRPSSPLCPIAIPLAQMIKAAIHQVPDVTGQTIEVTNYVQASLLTELMNLEA